MAARRACNSAPRRSASMAAMVSASVACSISLSATASSFSLSCARYTSAMPPRPSLRTISYLPILRLAGAIIVGQASRPVSARARQAKPPAPPAVAHALLRAASSLYSTPLRPEAAGVGMSADAAGTSARATSAAASLLRLSRGPCRTIRPRRGAHRPQEEVELLDAVRGRGFQHVAVKNIAQQRWFGAVARGHSRALIRLDQVVR